MKKLVSCVLAGALSVSAGALPAADKTFTTAAGPKNCQATYNCTFKDCKDNTEHRHFESPSYHNNSSRHSKGHGGNHH